MSVILSFLALVALAAGWWLARQRLASKPWLEAGAAPPQAEAPAIPAAKIGLGVFIAVIGGLFAMLGSAFVMQIDETPWQLVPLPQLVWLNTAILAIASLFMQFAARAAQQGRGAFRHANLSAAALAGTGFLAGQYQAWQVLTETGYPLNGPPAAGFFYLITGLHGLHILGGLAALALLWPEWSSADARARATALCAAYWHALLAIWLLLLVLLMGWGNAFLSLCRAAVT